MLQMSRGLWLYMYIFSAVQIILNYQKYYRNIIGVLQAAVCLYVLLALLQIHVATCHLDHEGCTTLYRLLQYSIELNVYSI